MLKSIFCLFTGLMLSASVLAEQMPAESQPESTAAETMPAETTEQTAPQQTDNTAIAEEQSGFSRGSVMRSVFTNGIESREPVDNIKTAGNHSNKIIYFTELRDMSGQTARHRWEHNGNVMADVEFNVKGPRWRVWSSKSFIPQWQGEWKVSVLNAAGEVISEDVLDYKQPEEPSATSGEMKTDLTEPSTQEMPQQ